MLTSNRIVRWIVVLSALLLLFWGNMARAQSAQVRIVSTIKNEERVTVPNSAPALIKRSVDTGRLPGGQSLGRMLLLLTPTDAQDQQAADLVAAQHDSSSPLFHKWLTPAQYGERFGVATEDAQRVQGWLQTQGLQVHEISRSRRFVVFSGTVGQVEQAFSTQMHSYSFNNRKFVANSTDIQIPAALSEVVKGVVRLHSDPHAPALKIGDRLQVNRKTGKIEGPYGLHFMGPADFATIYNVQPLYDAGVNGAGQSIAIVSRSSLFDSNYGIDGVQDIRDFRTVMGLPPNDPEVIVNGDDPLVQSFEDTIEAMLDVTWAGAVAPMAHIYVVASQSNFADGVDVSAAYVVDHNLAPIMSTSFGSCEQNLGPVQNAFYNALWRQAAAQGITAFVSAGDNGGAGCDNQSSGLFASSGIAVNGLASTPYNVAVGGTQFDDTDNPDAYWAIDGDPATLKSALSYIPEKVWNESSNDPFFTSLWAGSGGVSTVYAKPNWQTASGVPNDGKRDLPDISLAAAGHTGYAVCFEGSCSSPDFISVLPVSGTSASSPAAAGVMALVLQRTGGQPQGVANYVFYKLAATSGVYHDITKGDNKVPDPNGRFTVGYAAAPGFDLATGLGSFDANALVNNWSAVAATSGPTTTLQLANGQSASMPHGSPVSFKAHVTCTGARCSAPTGEVALQGTSVTGDFAGLGSAVLTPGTPTSSATATTSTIPGGTYAVSARYSGDGKYYTSTSNPINVTVTPEPSQMVMGGISGGYFISSPLTLGYGEPVTLYVAVAGKSGQGHPSGQISLLVDGVPPSTVARDYQTPSTLTLNYGESSNFFGNGVALSGQSSVLPNLSPGFSAGSHPVQASYPGDNSFNPAQTNYSFTITKEDTLIGDFFPLGTAVANVPVTLAGQIVLANNGCAPYGGTVTITDYTSGSPVVLGSAPASQQYCDSYSVPVTFKTGGTHLIRVNFSGDSNVNASFYTYNFPVSSNASSYIDLGVDNPNVVVGTPVTLRAQVASDVRQYAATGSVTFGDGSATLGTAKLDPTGTATLVVKNFAAGVHNISANYSGDPILQASSGGPVTEMVADFALQTAPSTLILATGQSGSATLNIVPIGGSTQALQLSCGKLPENLACSFSPSTLTLDGMTTAAVKINLSTKWTYSTLFTPRRTFGATASLAFAALILPLGIRRRRKLLLGVACILVVALYGVGCAGSGSSSNSSSTGTDSAQNHSNVYVINVTATSGTDVKTTPLVVVLNR